VLTGGTARDLLIGGAGADRLNGNAGDDVLVAGTTAYDGDPAALDAIRAEWGRDLPFNTRVANLAAGVGPGGSIKLGAGTVFDDAATDVLTGTAGSDWFLFNGAAGRTSVTDKTSSDLATQVGVL
jgi:Ca2+-binding RTX toxin-like protein